MTTALRAIPIVGALALIGWGLLVSGDINDARWLALLVLCLGDLMIVLDVSIVGWDLFNDTGVIKVDPAEHTVTPIPLGDSGAVYVFSVR